MDVPHLWGHNSETKAQAFLAYNLIYTSKNLIIGNWAVDACYFYSGGYLMSEDLGGGGGKLNWTNLFLPNSDPNYGGFWGGGSGMGCPMTR